MRDVLRTGWILVLLALIVGPARIVQSAPTHAFYVQVVGNGPPMILIPGLASSGDAWKTTVARYQGRYTCHVLTLAGFAGQPPIHEPLFATARAELADYIQANHLARPIIVGHSLGGTLAMALAADHPDQVGPLVIVDALPFLAGAQLSAKTVDDARPQTAAMRAYMSSMTRAQYEQYVETGAATRSLVTSSSDHDVIKGWSKTSDPLTVGSAMADVYGLDLRPDLSRIDSPMLVIGTWAGVSDQAQANGSSVARATVVSQFEQQYGRARQLHFVLADPSRHFIMFDNPRWFFEQLEAFLANPLQSTAQRGFARIQGDVR